MTFSENGKISIQFTPFQQKAIEEVARKNGISINAAAKIIFTAGMATLQLPTAPASIPSRRMA